MTDDTKVHDPVLGEITVYREFKPRDSAVEFTVYFQKDGKRARCDFSISDDDLINAVDSEELARHTLYTKIDKGEYQIYDEELGKMREVTRDEHFPQDNVPADPKKHYTDDSMGRLEQEQDRNPRGTGPSETDLVMVALLMRLYDVNMALLSHFDKETADSIYDTHNNGGTFNPNIFIPDAPTREEVSEPAGEEGTGLQA